MSKLSFTKPPFSKEHVEILLHHNNNQRALDSAKFILNVLDIKEDHPEFKSYVEKVEKAKPVYFDWLEIELETIKTNLTLEKNEQPIEVLKPKFDRDEMVFFEAFNLDFVKYSEKDFENRLKEAKATGDKGLQEKLTAGISLLKAFHLWCILELKAIAGNNTSN